MKIPITLKNEPKLTATLKEVNGRSTSHTFTTGKDLLHAAAMAEDALYRLNLPKSKRAGATAIIWSGSKMPGAYKYRINVNRVTLLRTSTGWTATEIKLAEVWDGGAQNITVLPIQEEIILAGIRSQYTVAR
jgi:hypothetical protein